MNNLENNLKKVLQRINELSSLNQTSVRLVAVSKTKPVEDIVALYHAGQRYFGENYVDELEIKSNHDLIITECPEIRWHLVGHLQSNKINRILARVPNLDCIQTVDSIELANRLNNNLKQQSKTLNILLQINTSNEQQKSGIQPKDCLSLYEHIKLNCSQLICQGLMTIGSLNNVRLEDDSDFQILIQCRNELCEKYGFSVDNVELSMGMSNDYERAIQLGSTIVRVGNLLFGNRH